MTDNTEIASVLIVVGFEEALQSWLASTPDGEIRQWAIRGHRNKDGTTSVCCSINWGTKNASSVILHNNTDVFASNADEAACKALEEFARRH